MGWKREERSADVPAGGWKRCGSVAASMLRDAQEDEDGYAHEWHAVEDAARTTWPVIAAPAGVRVPDGGRRAAAPAEPAPPMLHRLAVVYLMLPVLVWLVGGFEWWFGLPAAALLAGALRRPLSGPWRLRAPTPGEAAVLAVAAAGRRWSSPSPFPSSSAE